ncbi:MAG: S-adenosylmethionine decarboxylase [Acidobacteria bacterium]|nr:S-adenosylmethionine decarboxylase [Acidobacteriota bacterium]
MQKNLPAQHLLVDFFGVTKDKLNDQNFFLQLFKDTTNLELNLLSEPILKNLPSGIYTGILLFDIGHLCFRSHPESNHLAMDIFLEDNTDPEKIFALWAKNFSPETIRKTTITRGLYDS